VTGQEPEIASATQTLHAGGADIATEAALTFPSGFTAALKCSMQPESGRPMAMLRVIGGEGEMTVLNPLAPQYGHALTWRRGNGEPLQETFPMRATYDYQLDAVVNALNAGASVPTEGEDIVDTMRVIDAIKTRAKQGDPV
jgi:predicted dehydrogenase